VVGGLIANTAFGFLRAAILFATEHGSRSKVNPGRHRGDSWLAAPTLAICTPRWRLFASGSNNSPAAGRSGWIDADAEPTPTLNRCRR